MIPLRDDNPTSRFPIVTLALILASVATFLFVQPSASRSIDMPDAAQVVEEVLFTYEYAAIPCEIVQGRPLTIDEIGDTQYRGETTSCRESPSGRTPFPDKSIWLSVVVSMFLHGGWIHLAGNMIFLWVFGNNIEDHLGSLVYLGFYVAAGTVATIAHVMMQLDSTVPMIGASGAIAGVMGAYLIWFPWVRVRTLFMIGIIPLWPRVPAAMLLTVWFIAQFFTVPGSGVAWVAHVGGFAFGAVLAAVARRDARFRRRLQLHRSRVNGLRAGRAIR